MKALYILGGLAGLYLLLTKQQAFANTGFNSGNAPRGISATGYNQQNQIAAIGQQAAGVPVVGPIIAGVTKLFAKLNHPYGTCAPSAPDSDSFLACWKHAIPNDFIPYWKGQPTDKQPGTLGWDFAFCRGASAGRSSGCNKTAGPKGPACDCSSNPCVCAPAGAVVGLRDGTFMDANGNNLGPAVARVDVPITGLFGSLFQ